MAQHVSETGQGAFTWTGPYGGGKSSLALAFACLAGAKKAVRDQAIDIFGEPTVSALKSALPYFPARWDVLPIITEKRSLTEQLAEALDIQIGKSSLSQAVLKELQSRTAERGLVLIIDELGRGLEAAASGEGDIHILQDIAELASRSDGRFLFIGILHQSFEEYAERLGREARDSWAKIQGRFVDISITVSLDETIDLIAEAIGSMRAPQALKALADECARELRPSRTDAEAKRLATSLARCAPLHPLAACLIGPLSRRRFGQNQRSVFSFLASSEQHGLQDALAESKSGELYPVSRLWDYVRANLESAVLASPDSRRWAVAADAIERCAARGGSEHELRVLKTIGMIDLLKDRSGLISARSTLKLALPDINDKAIDGALRSLERASEIVFRKHANAYVLYSGSDFDVDGKVDEALSALGQPDVSLIQSLADLQPLLAKRHHRETGAMRWFNIAIEAVSDLASAKAITSKADIIGQIILAIPTQGETPKKAEKLISEALERDSENTLLIGYSATGARLVDYARELAALLSLGSRHPELRGDTVARREIDARSADLRRRIEDEIQSLFESSEWHVAAAESTQLSKRALSELLSKIADETFPYSPRLQNELLNCTAPSSNAVSARTKLMKRMVLRDGDEDLGFGGKNYPAERGLYVSLLKETGLHVSVDSTAYFAEPAEGGDNLDHLWLCADALLASKTSGMVSAQDLIDAWEARPIGLKQGLGPVFIIAYAMSRKDRVAVYGEGVFQSRFNDLCVEFLARNPSDIGLRQVEMEGVTGAILRNLGELLKLETSDEPLSVARAIVGQFDDLVPWTSKTQALSPTTLQVREILKRASDPNKLLFDDLPALVQPKKDGTFDAKLIARVVRDALAEMRAAYPNTLAELKALMLNELDVRADTQEAIADLRSRADNIRQIGGDLRLDAFIGRLAQFHGTQEDMEGLASIAAEKLPRDWNDSNRERARVGMAELAGAFLRLETMARVRGRKDGRQAMAVMVGHGGAPLPLFSEFEVSDSDRKDITALATAVDLALSQSDHKRREVILAALVEVTSRYLDDEDQEKLRVRA
ncbi:ATP-binding protein [Hyphomonas oceanitis SCH89]|uniref:ATP-binding protein n=2 Tax=Hyphomonas oceanitis TaxID=81033 RepID=A0A059G2K5_9PROT|nr:ATP-binding protein [Hyphomonas oceanitis SCH89]